MAGQREWRSAAQPRFCVAATGDCFVAPGRHARRSADDFAAGSVGRNSACRVAAARVGGVRRWCDAARAHSAEAAPISSTCRVRPEAGSWIAPVARERNVGARRHIRGTPALRTSDCSRQRRSGDQAWEHIRCCLPGIDPDEGIVADQAAAIAWYRKAAALGDTEAVHQLKRFAPAQ